MKRYNTPHRSRVVKTRMTEEEYAVYPASHNRGSHTPHHNRFPHQ